MIEAKHWCLWPKLTSFFNSPADFRLQAALNLDLSTSAFTAENGVDTMESEHKAILNLAAQPVDEASKAQFAYYLSVSQYRHSPNDLVDDWHTLLTYPVFDSFEADKQLAGMVFTDIYWKILFSNLSNLDGIICVIENSHNQTFAYRIDGHTATSLGRGDPHDPKYNRFEVSTDINTHLSDRASPENRAYNTVHLSDTVQYTMRVYPSQATEDAFISNEPTIYMLITFLSLSFAALVFLLYSYTVDRRQRTMTAKVIEQVNKAAQTERELNEFLSHEVSFYIENIGNGALSRCPHICFCIALFRSEIPWRPR